MGLREMPVSLPANNGVAAGPWSGVPLWRGLDSDFLCSPAIPKAPAAPRVKIEMAGRALRIVDDDVAMTLLHGEGRSTKELVTRTATPQSRLLLIFALVGFAGGIIVAWLLGALR